MAPFNPIIYPIVLLVAGIVVVLILVSLATSLTIRDLRKHFRVMTQAWKTQDIQFVQGPALANFLNQRRLFGMRGNGALVLTTQDVRFAQLVPNREIVIHMSDITAVRLVRKFNGRWGGGPFLAIQNKNGEWIGFQTEHPQEWAENIEAKLQLAPVPQA